MKKLFVLSFYLLSFQAVSAQIDVVGGMGISFVYSPSLTDYLNLRADEELQAFSSSVEFYGEVDYTLSGKYQLGIEYVYSLYDFSSSYAGGYTLNYTQHKPSILAYYVISGEGYKFKFGAGAGVRILNLTENIIIDEDFSTIGFGMLVRAQGHTKLGDNIYANIGTTLRTDFLGVPSNSKNEFHNNTNFNSFSTSVDIGLSYFF